MKKLPKGKDIEMVFIDSTEFYYLFVKHFGYKFPKLTRSAFISRYKITPTQGWHLRKQRHKNHRNLRKVHETGMYLYRSEFFHLIMKHSMRNKYIPKKKVERKTKLLDAVAPLKRINTHGGVVFMDEINDKTVELCGAYV